jgi:hypothetical protein
VALLPDPVTCYTGALLEQTLEVRLAGLARPRGLAWLGPAL